MQSIVLRGNGGRQSKNLGERMPSVVSVGSQFSHDDPGTHMNIRDPVK